jgi:hypothetical protein
VQICTVRDKITSTDFLLSLAMGDGRQQDDEHINWAFTCGETSAAQYDLGGPSHMLYIV